MITTAGCGDDFTGCVTLAAADNASAAMGSTSKTKMTTIQGTFSSIQIAATTKDTLLAKRVLCDSVTNNCMAAIQKDKDAVWKAFLAESAPAIKSAELTAESNVRMSCISNIAACFQKGCKDTIDPNNPDGSFDMCLTRPEALFSVCKVPLNACGIMAVPAKNQGLMNTPASQIWNFVLARLAAMQVDSCTTEFRNCLTADTSCGKDFSNCIGLDLLAIQQMCPVEKLVGCTNSDGTPGLKSISEITNLVQGVFLSIDNSYVAKCQSFAEAQMTQICGNSLTCEIFDKDASIGTDSLVSITGSDGNLMISGLISFGDLQIKQDEATGDYVLNVTKYMGTLPSNTSNEVRQRIQSALNNISGQISRTVGLLAADAQIEMCVRGRDMSQIRGGSRSDANRTVGRFPNLLNSYAQTIANAALNAASRNYNKKLAGLVSTALGASSDYQNQMYCNAMVQSRDSSRSGLLGSKINKESGILSMDRAQIVISGARANDMLTAIKQNSALDEIITGDDGQMIAKRTTSAVYEPGSQACHITTTTQACTGFEGIYNSQSSSWNASASVSVAGFGIGGGGGRSQSSTTYQGKYCGSFAQPIISESIINFASGAATAATTSRDQLTSYYNDTSSVSNVTQKSGGGFSLGLSVGNMSNIGSGNSKTIGDNNNSPSPSPSPAPNPSPSPSPTPAPSPSPSPAPTPSPADK